MTIKGTANPDEATKASIAQTEGDLPRASAILAPLHPGADDTKALETQVSRAVLERRPAQTIPRLKGKYLPCLIKRWVTSTGELRFYLGWAQQIAGDHTAAKESWRQALGELEPFLKEQPQNYALVDDLAMTHAFLVNKAANLVEQATATVPIEKDALIGPSLFALAAVAARTAEPDRAMAALQKLLSIPAGTDVTSALLRLDPMFDPLRNDPRCQKLCEEKPK